MSASTETRLRVVELAQGVAGPACGRLFAALGHEVVKVEPLLGDHLRHRVPVDAEGTGLSFVALNADKRSLVGALGNQDTRATVESLFARADVVVVDGEARALAGGWLEPDRLAALWPELIVVWLSERGNDEPGISPRADSLLAESFGGLATMIGDPDERPLALGADQVEYGGAFAGFFGAMAALRRRDAGGPGESIDIALCDVAALMDWKSDVANVIDPEPPVRRGSARGQWRIVRARDGWVGIIYQPWQWHLMRRLIEDERLADPAFAEQSGRNDRAEEFWQIIGDWAAARSKTEIYGLAQSIGLPFGFIADAADLVESPQYRARGFVRREAASLGGVVPALGSPVHCTGLDWRSGRSPALGEFDLSGSDADETAVQTAERLLARPDSADSRGTDASAAPLDGMVVLDFGTITAGAASARLLADYGATVISVESIDHPDPFRAWKSTGNDSAYFASNNVGKSGVVVDLKTEEGRALVHELARGADVLIENYRVGVTTRLGIDFDSIHAINPELVYLSMSSQGQDGPESKYSSYGSTIDLLSGLASVTGYRPGEPMWSSSDVNYPDQLVSLLGAGLIVYCLQQGRLGVHLDVSQREVVSWTMGGEIAEFVLNGRIAGPTGNRRPGSSPHDTYPTAKDEWIAVACQTAEHRSALATVIGHPELAAMEAQGWVDAADRIDGLIGGWSQGRSRAECVAALTVAGVPNAPVLTAADRLVEPRFRMRRVRLDGEVPLKGYPMVLRNFEPPTPSAAPVLGQDTRHILQAWGGLTSERVRELEDDGVIYAADQLKEEVRQ